MIKMCVLPRNEKHKNKIPSVLENETWIHAFMNSKAPAKMLCTVNVDN